MIVDLYLTPRPWKIEFQDGSFTLDAGIPIHIGPEAGRETLHSASVLRDAVEASTGLRLQVVKGSTYSPSNVIRGEIELMVKDRDEGEFWNDGDEWVDATAL